MNNMNLICKIYQRSLHPLSRSLSSFKPISVFMDETRNTCNHSSAIKEAENVVGYPTSFLSLRWILNDEIANIALHIRKLIGINHPLLKTAKSLLLRNDQATWGLIVLLMSKVAGLNSKFSEVECDKTADVLHSQRIIAEVTEMIRTSHLMHKGLVNITSSTENAPEMNYGNKLALLCGDYLLSTSFHEVALLKNFQVQETISSSLRDFAESQFIGIRDDQNEPIPSKPLAVQKNIEIPFEFGVKPTKTKDLLGNMKSEWMIRNILGGASLLAKACQCSLILANHEPRVQELGYEFGRHFALAWQASLEKDLINDETFSLVLAPVMFHLEHDPSFYQFIEKPDYDFIRTTVRKGPGISKTTEVQQEFSNLAMEVLDKFPASDSKKALQNIIRSL